MDETDTPKLAMDEKQDLARTTMGKDLLEALVAEIRLMVKPWEALTQEDQDEVINRLRLRIEDLTRQAVGIITHGEKDVIPATVDSVTFKDGIRAVLKIPKTARGRHELSDREGGDVVIVIVIADPTEYLVGIGAVKGTPDQRPLPGVGDAANTAIDNAKKGPPGAPGNGEPPASGTKPVDPHDPAGSL